MHYKQYDDKSPPACMSVNAGRELGIKDWELKSGSWRFLKNMLDILRVEGFPEDF